MSRRRSLRSNKASSEAGNKEKLLMSINQDPQLGGEGPEPILSPKSSKEPSGSHLEDELTDILWLEPLMGPPPRKKGQCTQSANRPILQTLVPPSSFPSSPDSSSSKEQNIDISPESSLLPLFKTVTHYSEGFRKVCFVNFDRYPGPAIIPSKEISDHVKNWKRALSDEIGGIKVIEFGVTIMDCHLTIRACSIPTGSYFISMEDQISSSIFYWNSFNIVLSTRTCIYAIAVLQPPSQSDVDLLLCGSAREKLPSASVKHISGRMLELHIWGPAFSLPSIDPQCNAAVAYLNITLQRDQWTIIASSNPLLSPTRQLPALRDGMTWATGFRGIVEYLRKKSEGQANLDALLSDIEKADCIAFSAFLESHGQSLIDLSLYVSAKNFDAITRSTYATLLPFPMKYYTPGVIRSQAVARTAGLGITALDIGTSETAVSATSLVGTPHTTTSAQAQSPSIVTSTETAAIFKLTDLVRDFLEPLQARLGSKRYFFGTDPSTIDCLAAGYLSLCLYPELPNPWLANEMRKEFPRLCGYLNDIRTQLFGKFVDASEVLAYTRGSIEREKAPETELPWAAAERGDLPWMSGFAVDCALDAIGLGREAQAKKQRQKEREKSIDPEDLERNRKMEAAIRSQRIRGALTVVGGVVTFIGYCIWSGFLQIKLKEEKEEEGETQEGDDKEREEEGEEEEEEEEEEGNKEEKQEEDLDEHVLVGPSGYGLAGAILGLRGPTNPNNSAEEEHNEDNEDLSPEEEEEITNDISAEEDEINEAIAKDVEEDIEGKDE